MSQNVLDRFSLTGKIALVTGASYGIGFAIASALHQAGATIVFNDISKDNMEKGLAGYKAAGIEAHGFIFDVTDEQGVEKGINQIEQQVGVIDILVNNAGIIQRTPMLETTAADFRKVIDIDLTGQFIMAKAVLPSMIKKGHGKIINICSMMSELGRETVVGYASAKGGLKMLTKNICSEFGEANIQCNGIGPGYIATPQTAPLREIQPDGSRHPFDQFIIAKTPAARWGTPEDLAGSAVFLASDASNFVNGHILYVDGGILAYIDNAPDSVASVLKVFGILQALSEEKDIGVTELSQKVMMSKSTVYRFLQTMKSLGYVNQEGESDKYSLSLKLFELSNKALEKQNFLKIADEEMRALSNLTKETVHLAVREDNYIVYINKISSEHYNLCMSSRVGSHASIHGTGLGKILLAWLDKKNQQEIVNTIEFTQYTEKTITTAKRFMDELELVKHQGFAEDNEETELGLRCFAVPIYNHMGVVTASLSMSTSIFRCNDDVAKDLVNKLHHAASEICQRIGYSNYPFIQK